MRLRILIAAAFIKRLWHRRTWRRQQRDLVSLTVTEVLRTAQRRGIAPEAAVQEWLARACAHDACRPRRPSLLRLPDDPSGESSSNAESSGDGWMAVLVSPETIP